MKSHQKQLAPELQQLVDDFVSVRRRFVKLTEAYSDQQIRLQKQQTELNNATKQLSAMGQKQTENEGIIESYNQLKIDYELMVSASGKHREEIYTENKKRVRDLEEELKEARAKSSQQAELHQSSVVQIVADYEAKLRDADEKIRQLDRFGNNAAKSNMYENNSQNIYPYSSIERTTVPRGVNKKTWPKLNVEIAPRGSASRGRGRRSRGGQSKRKLFKLDNDIPVDVE